MRITNTLVTNVFGETFSLNTHGSRLGIEISWIVDEKQITKSVVDRKNHGLSACISSDQKEVTIVYGSLQGISSSHGAAIFNINGSIKNILLIPKLISTQYKLYEKKVGLEKARSDLRFSHCYMKGYGTEERLIVGLTFNYEWCEEREVDMNTGEFGKCIEVSKL